MPADFHVNHVQSAALTADGSTIEFLGRGGPQNIDVLLHFPASEMLKSLDAIWSGESLPSKVVQRDRTSPAMPNRIEATPGRKDDVVLTLAVKGGVPLRWSLEVHQARKLAEDLLTVGRLQN